MPRQTRQTRRKPLSDDNTAHEEVHEQEDEDPEELGLPPEYRRGGRYGPPPKGSRRGGPQEAGHRSAADDANIEVPLGVQLSVRAFNLLSALVRIVQPTSTQETLDLIGEVDQWRDDFQRLMAEERKRYEDLENS